MIQPQELPPFDALCVMLGQGKAVDNDSFCAIQMRDGLCWPKYDAGDSVPIDFTTEPLIGEWGVVDAMFRQTAHRFFGIIHRRDRRGVAVAIYRWPNFRSHVHFIAAHRIMRVGWARPWDADNLLVSYLKLKAAQARAKAA